MRVSLLPFKSGFVCSECRTFYSVYEYNTYYNKYSLNCKCCGAVFGSEKKEEYIQLTLFNA